MIGRRSLLIVLNNLLGAGLGFVALNFVAELPKASPGFYAWAASIIGVAALISALGFPQAHIKRVTEGLDETSANGTYLMIKVTLTTLFAVVVFGGFLVFRFVLGRTFQDSTTDAVFVTVVVAYILLSLRQIFDVIFQTHQHTARAEAVLLVDTIVSVLGVSAAWALWEASWDHSFAGRAFADKLAAGLGVGPQMGTGDVALLLALAYTLGKAVSLIFAALLFLAHRYPMGRPSRQVLASYWAYGFPLAIAGGITVLSANLDRSLLGYFWTAEEVSNFHIPFTILTPMLFVSTAVATLLFPSISRWDARGEKSEIQGQTRRAERYMTMVLFPQVVLAGVFAPEGLNIFDAQYVDQAGVLRILLVSVFFTVLATPARSVLFGVERVKSLVALGVLSLLIIGSLNLLLVPSSIFGVRLGNMRATGAAIALAASSLVTYFYIKHKALPWMGRDYLTPGFLRQSVAAILMGAACWLVRDAVGGAPFTRLWQLVLVGVLATGVYGLLLVALREFRKADWEFLMDMVHPVKMAGYVGKELTPKGKQ